MLDWTTSFLSDETIIKLSWKSVKHFLGVYNIYAQRVAQALLVESQGQKCPAFLRGIDENQEATPVALEDQPCWRLRLQFVRHVGQCVKYFMIQRLTRDAILFLEDGGCVSLRESVALALQ